MQCMLQQKQTDIAIKSSLVHVNDAIKFSEMFIQRRSIIQIIDCFSCIFIIFFLGAALITFFTCKNGNYTTQHFFVFFLKLKNRYINYTSIVNNFIYFVLNFIFFFSFSLNLCCTFLMIPFCSMKFNHDK